MKTIADIRTLLAEHKIELIEKYGVKEIGVFGSYLREEQKETSDVDILVEFKRPVGMLRFINLKNYLSDLLGINVDLVMKRALKPRIGRRILNEVIYV
ncbi:MAG: nucleotidyltransferase family protein [Thermodesulfobacteriota bacterium]|nr:nucleotidyltransferase family protein [Thermodesulfobacteriota bacterium]